MFIWTARLRPKRILSLLLVIAALATGAFVYANHDSAPVGASFSIETKPVKTDEDRIDFLSQCGWVVDKTPLLVEELLIPKEMDDTYTSYINFQAEQGFDLEKYAGCRVKRYSYEILNYPTGEQGVQVGILVYKNEVIGGEVLSVNLQGFMHGLILEP